MRAERDANHFRVRFVREAGGKRDVARRRNGDIFPETVNPVDFALLILGFFAFLLLSSAIFFFF